MNILGLNAYHGDSAACLVQEGRLVAAAEEERFRRVKHWAGFPSQAIAYCLGTANISLADVDHICVNSDSRANLFKKISYTLKNKPRLGFILDRLDNRKQRSDVAGELAHSFPGEQFNGTVVQVEHHLAHLVSAHSVSPFDESVSVSLDGFGDFSSGAWGRGEGSRIAITRRIYFPHSLGIFYQAMTQFLGFPHYGDEYKVMGLAPYGNPSYLEQMRQLVHLEDDGGYQLNLSYFRHHRMGVEYEWAGGLPKVGRLFADALSGLLGFPARSHFDHLEQHHFDLARSTQAMYEEAFFHLLCAAHSSYPSDNLTLAGGCAMNSVANGKVYRQTPFTRLYLQPAAGDAGGAVGAAFAKWYALCPSSRQKRYTMQHAYLGPEYNDEAIRAVLDDQEDALRSEGCMIRRIDDEDRLCRLTAAAIADGLVIGWFQGRMEWGPRALGNRSILCDPRRTDMKEVLNLKIKRRESFRPFAPSILRTSVPDWFEEDDDVPFMMQVFQIRPEKRTLIPAVTHVDGSGRLQTVDAEANPRYWKLITAFKELTGIPIVLNTSFNENEPIVCKPEQALDCFLRTRMDVLVLGNWLLRRRC